jgi:hypothetical protein
LEDLSYEYSSGRQVSMRVKILSVSLCISLVFSLILMAVLSLPALAITRATTEVYLVKFAQDGTTVLEERTVDYEWMRDNLPKQGDGKTHYYHQGPVFEGDRWDPGETVNLKDKGAVQGTDIRDLCELIGGMSPGDEVMIHAPDGYHTEYGYENVYEPLDRQGSIVVCWYNGEDSSFGERWGVGYPGDGAYRTAIQIVIMAKTQNPEGKYVFGNTDMQECLSELSQHFYSEGSNIYPSTNGLSVKWVDELRIYTGGYTGDRGGPAKTLPDDTSGQNLWIPIVCGVVGAIVVAGLVIFFLRRRRVGKSS